MVPVGLDINGTHIRSAREGMLRVKAQLVRQARSHIFHEVEIEERSSGRVLCRCRVTNYLISTAKES